MGNRTTLKDIAKRANVSEATVSMVLNKKKNRISAQKKEEINLIAKELKYRPNQLARSLSLSKTNTIGLIIPDIENPYFSSLSKSIEDYLRSKNYLTFIGNSDEILENDLLLLRRFKDYQVDGIIICFSNESYITKSYSVKSVLDDLDLPFVLVDRIFDDFSTNQVSYDNEYGGYIATKKLIDWGCQNIACVTGDLETMNGRKRYEGHKRALNEAGLNVSSTNKYKGDYKFETGFEQGLKIIQEHTIDGVFACNDLMAYGIIKAMEVNNVPREKIKIVGYDGLKQSEMFGIKLVSVSQNVEKLSVEVCRQLIRQISDRDYIKNKVLKPEIKE